MRFVRLPIRAWLLALVGVPGLLLVASGAFGLHTLQDGNAALQTLAYYYHKHSYLRFIHNASAL